MLSAPHAASTPDAVAHQVLEIVSESKLSDPQKIDNLLRQVVDPKVVWDAISPNLKAFSHNTKFDGGFEIKALVRDNWSEANFSEAGMQTFALTIRSIRNALSHGREQRMTAVITPTTRNFSKLQPWVSVIAAAAREVMIYRALA